MIGIKVEAEVTYRDGCLIVQTSETALKKCYLTNALAMAEAEALHWTDTAGVLDGHGAEEQHPYLVNKPQYVDVKDLVENWKFERIENLN